MTDEMYGITNKCMNITRCFSIILETGVDENGSVSVPHTTFTDYEDFLEHIKDTHRRHIYIAEDLEEYEESAAETIAALNATNQLKEDVPNQTY